jgi:hypothetical protein
MPQVSIEEIELLSFFECEPKMKDQGVPWLYNDALYEFRQGSHSISFAFAPSYKDVRIIFKSGEAILYELNATGVKDVRYHNDSGLETLEVVISSLDTICIRLKPNVSIRHTAKDQP